MSESLTRGEQALAQATFGKPYGELMETQQESFLRILNDMPDHLRAGLDGNLLTKAQLAEGMEDVFQTMVANDEIPKEWKDGAAVFAKGLHKKFGIESDQ